MSLRTALLWVLLAALTSTALLAVAMLVFTFGDARPVSSTLLLSLVAAIALSCRYADERGVAVVLMRVGLGAASLCLVLGLALTWLGPSVDDDTVAKPAVIFGLMAGWIALFGLMRLAPVRGIASAVRWTTIAAGGALMLLISGMILVEDGSDMLARLGLGLAIIVCVGSAIVPVVVLTMRAQREDQSEESLDRRVSVELICPRCETAQSLLTGARACARCGLRITIDVEMPRCACGYLLLHMEGKTCPECGAAC